MAGRIALAWSFTLPAAAVVGAAASWLAATGTVGVIIVAVSGMAVAAGIYAASRRNAVTAANVNDVPPRRPRPPTSPPDQERDSSVHIDWATLVAVAVVAAAAALTVVLLVAFALVGLPPPGPAGRPPGRAGTPAPRPPLGTVIAGLCLLAAGLIVCYGLYLIIA